MGGASGHARPQNACRSPFEIIDEFFMVIVTHCANEAEGGLGMDTPKKIDGKQDTRFQPGQSGNPNGRPKGSRNKLGEAFLQDLYVDWLKNGADAIAKVRAEKPDVYLKVVAATLPQK